jgi:hypothetical protein
MKNPSATSATELEAMLGRLDALLARSRVLSTQHEIVLEEAEALIATVNDAVATLNAITAEECNVGASGAGDLAGSPPPQTRVPKLVS